MYVMCLHSIKVNCHYHLGIFAYLIMNIYLGNKMCKLWTFKSLSIVSLKKMNIQKRGSNAGPGLSLYAFFKAYLHLVFV